MSTRIGNVIKWGLNRDLNPTILNRMIERTAVGEKNGAVPIVR